MKKTIVTLLFLLTFIGVKANNEPTLVLEVHYTKQSEANMFQNDSNLCCLFDLKTMQSGESYTRVIHKESGVVLGTFYGTPTKEFIMEIYQKQLTPDYINYIVPKLLMVQGITKE